MMLQTKLERIGEALAAAVNNVYHYWRPNMSAPFCVWGEDGEDDSFNANNRKKEQSISGYVDYYTKTEFDPVVDTIQETLNGFEFPFGWRLATVDYEEETNLIHYSWEWVTA